MPCPAGCLAMPGVLWEVAVGCGWPALSPAGSGSRRQPPAGRSPGLGLPGEPNCLSSASWDVGIRDTTTQPLSSASFADGQPGPLSGAVPHQQVGTGADTPSATIGDNGTSATTAVRERCQQLLLAATWDGETETPPAASSTSGPSTKQGCSCTGKNRHCLGSQQQQGPFHSTNTGEHWASGRAPASNAGSEQQGQPQQQVTGAAPEGVSQASAPTAPHQAFGAANEDLPGRSSSEALGTSPSYCTGTRFSSVWQAGGSSTGTETGTCPAEHQSNGRSSAGHSHM